MSNCHALIVTQLIATCYLRIFFRSFHHQKYCLLRKNRAHYKFFAKNYFLLFATQKLLSAYVCRKNSLQGRACVAARGKKL